MATTTVQGEVTRTFFDGKGAELTEAYEIRGETRKTEQWRAIPGYEGLYEVSDEGRVRSLDRVVQAANRTLPIRGRMIAPALRKDGRYHVSLSRANRKQTFFVHRLVLLAFVGPSRSDQEACHNNGDSTDNRLANLRWDTHTENVQDTIRHGNQWQINKTHCPRNHEYTPENTYLFPSGNGRACRTCQRARYEAQRNRKVA